MRQLTCEFSRVAEGSKDIESTISKLLLTLDLACDAVALNGKSMPFSFA